MISEKKVQKLIDKNNVKGLIKALNNHFVSGKIIDALVNMKNPDKIELLINAINDRDPYIRAGVERALGYIRDPRAVEPLIKSLSDNNKIVRIAAVISLSMIKNPRSTEKLIEALNDCEPDVRKETAKALGDIKDNYAVVPLIEALIDNNPNVRKECVKALGEIKDLRATEPLINMLKDDDSGVQCGAVEALGKLEDIDAVEPLIEMLHFSKVPVSVVISSLGKLNDPRAVKPLFEFIHGHDYYVQLITASVLAKIGDADARSIALGKLIRALDDKDYRERMKAVELLGDLKDQNFIEHIINALEDENNNVMEAAKKALPNFIKIKDLKPDLKCCICEKDLPDVPVKFDNSTEEAFCQDDIRYFWEETNSRPNYLKVIHYNKDMQDAMNIIDNAYIVNVDPEVDTQFQNAIDKIISYGENGIRALIYRLLYGVSFSFSEDRVLLARWGDEAWNEFLKKREIIRALERENVKSSLNRLIMMFAGKCNSAQWNEIVVPALKSAILSLIKNN